MEHLTLYTHPTWAPGKVWWSLLLWLGLGSWFCHWILPQPGKNQAAFPPQSPLLDAPDWHFPRSYQHITSFISSTSADHKNCQDQCHFTDASGISPDLQQTKWNGNWVRALGGSHTLPFATPSHWGRQLDSKCSYSHGKGTSSKKKYSYIPKSWLSLSLMHLQPIAFDRKPFPGNI